MNYAELCAAVEAYCENTFEATDLATFTKQAETRIYNMVQIPALRKNVTGTLTTSNKYLTCPTDFLAVHSMAVITPVTGAYTYLLNKDVSFIREAYPSPTSTGSPRFYALFGPTTGTPAELSFILGPTPDANYSVELHYFFYPESIVTASTTWLGDNYDPVLFYGVLVEAFTFMRAEDATMALVNAKFGEAAQALKRLGDGLERRDSYRSGQARVPVM